MEAVEKILKMVKLSAERQEDTGPPQTDESSDGLMKNQTTGGETEKWFVVLNQIHLWSTFKNNTCPLERNENAGHKLKQGGRNS